MRKLLFTTAILLTLSGCVVGPPPDNERDRRAYGSLQDVDHHDRYDHNANYYHNDHGYYDNNHNWHDDDGHTDDDMNDYNEHTGQDHWAKHDSK